jgi:C4-dicarboxylate transporter DctQ subunit
MKKIGYYFNHLEEYMLTVLMGTMAILVFVQVIFRELGSSLSWSEELTRYVAVWVTFVGGSLGIKRGAHIGVEAIKVKLPEKARLAFDLIGLAVCAFFCYICIKYGITIIEKQIATAQKSPAMRIPMWWAYLAIPVGLGLGFIRCVQVAIDELKNEKNKGKELQNRPEQEGGEKN